MNRYHGLLAVPLLSIPVMFMLAAYPALTSCGGSAPPLLAGLSPIREDPAQCGAYVIEARRKYEQARSTLSIACTYGDREPEIAKGCAFLSDLSKPVVAVLNAPNANERCDVLRDGMEMLDLAVRTVAASKRFHESAKGAAAKD